MKIGIIHPNFDVVGGAEQTSLSLMNALQNSNHQVTLYTTTKEVQIPQGIKICHIKKNSFPIGWNIQRILDVEKIFKKTAKEDLLIISSGNLVLSNSPKPIIIYCHSTFDAEINRIKIKNFGVSKIYHNFVNKKIKKQLQLLDKPSVSIIANSCYTKERIYKMCRKESTVIYPPVKLKEIRTQRSRKGVITVSRYSPEKNLEFALKIMKDIKSTYKVFGNTRFLSQINHFNHLTKIIENNSQIELHRNVDRSIIERELNLSKIYLQTSIETFGISVIEGIMAGCIPIVPDNSANKETVPIRDLRYKPDDQDDAKKRINQALKGDFDSHLVELQKHAKKFSEKNFQNSMLEYISQFEKGSRS